MGWVFLQELQIEVYTTFAYATILVGYLVTGVVP